MIAYLTALLRKIEDTFIGDVEVALKPLSDIQAELRAILAKAEAAEAQAHADADALVARAKEHAQKALAADKALAKLTDLLG